MKSTATITSLLTGKARKASSARFTVLLDMLAYTSKEDKFSILDVGCGIGHLYEFLEVIGHDRKHSASNIPA